MPLRSGFNNHSLNRHKGPLSQPTFHRLKHPAAVGGTAFWVNKTGEVTDRLHYGNRNRLQKEMHAGKEAATDKATGSEPP